MKLKQGDVVHINHMETVVTRRNQANMIVETMERNRSGEYEYIGRFGNKMHFYDWRAGFDLFLTRKEFNEKVAI